MKLSESQRKVLWNIWNGMSPTHHCQGRSQFGGAAQTIASLFRKGFITKNALGGVFLTDGGRKWLYDYMNELD